MFYYTEYILCTSNNDIAIRTNEVVMSHLVFRTCILCLFFSSTIFVILLFFFFLCVCVGGGGGYMD